MPMDLLRPRSFWKPALGAAFFLCMCTVFASAQQLTQSAASNSSPPLAPTVDSLVLSTQSASPFSGSVPSDGKPSDETIRLSLPDAIQRGLKYNLGLYLSGQDRSVAASARLRRISELLPQVNGTLREQVQKVNLVAFGFNFPGFPHSIGPFGTLDARATATAPIIDVRAITRARAAGQEEKAAQLSYDNARELVVLVVTGNYLLEIANESRMEAAQSQLKTAQALYKLAVDQEEAGVSPNIDTLRQKVELQARQLSVIEAENQVRKQQIELQRAIGLPVGQRMELVDRVPYKELSELTSTDALGQALQHRSDYLALEAQLRSAELAHAAARQQFMPTLSFTGDYGVIGFNPGSLGPSWTAAAQLRIPVFTGGKIRSDIQEAEAELARRRGRVASMRGDIQREIEDALLDLQAARERLTVSRQTVDLASETLTQAQDRFSAGIANSIEVVQAQESLAGANDQYVSSLYAHNVAKLQVARALGVAAQVITDYLGSAPAPGGQPPASPPNFNP